MKVKLLLHNGFVYVYILYFVDIIIIMTDDIGISTVFKRKTISLLNNYRIDLWILNGYF